MNSCSTDDDDDDVQDELISSASSDDTSSVSSFPSASPHLFVFGHLLLVSTDFPPCFNDPAGPRICFTKWVILGMLNRNLRETQKFSVS